MRVDKGVVSKLILECLKGIGEQHVLLTKPNLNLRLIKKYYSTIFKVLNIYENKPYRVNHISDSLNYTWAV